MTQLFNFPLDVDFSGTYLQGNGVAGPGDDMRTGISDRLEIINGVARTTLYGADRQTNYGYRTEITFGTFRLAGNCGTRSLFGSRVPLSIFPAAATKRI